jgi:hypothetical protein
MADGMGTRRKAQGDKEEVATLVVDCAFKLHQDPGRWFALAGLDLYFVTVSQCGGALAPG